MKRVVLDIRANNDGGVARFGFELTVALHSRLEAMGIQPIVVARPHQADRLTDALAGDGAPVTATIETCADETGFVRDSPWLRALIDTSGAAAYYTTHYTVDRACSVPFAYTVHDLTRLRFPRTGMYSADEFVARFGVEQLQRVQDELNLLTAWDPSPDQDLLPRYFWALNRYLASRSRRIVTVSRATARDITELLGVPAGDIAVARCGVDTTVFYRRTAEATEDIRKRLGLNGTYCLYVGQAQPHKRLGWLLRTLVEAVPSIPTDARIVLVGGFAEQVPEVCELCRSSPLEPVVVLAGRLPDDELAALYSGAAALLSASLNEGNPLPPLEALACGAEVIAPRIPAFVECVGDHGHLYDPGDASELRDLVLQALHRTLAQRAGGFVAPTWERAADVVCDVLASMV